MVVALPAAVVHAGPMVAAAHARTNPAPHGWQVHTVRRGETVSGLTVTYRTTIGVIVHKNHLPHYGRVVHPGQKLWVPRTAASAAQAARTAKAGKTTRHVSAKPARTTARHIYVVRPGDTMSQIAVQHRMPLAALLKANRLGMRSVIHPGDRISVPAPRATRTTAATKATHPAGPLRLGVKEVPRAKVKAMIIATARKHGVDPKLALAIGWQESGWQQNIRSTANALGIMQVIPSSGEWASTLVGRRLNLRNAQDNVTAGVVILRALNRMADNRDQAIAGYYQGLASVQSRGLYTDTKQYVLSVNLIRKRM